MANGVNSIHLIGHLGQDPEVRHTPGGKEVCTISVATKYNQDTSWHRVTLWGHSAKFAGEHLTKGSLVYVSGRMEYRKYQKDGVEKTSAEIIAHTLQALGGKSRETSGPARDYPEPNGNVADDSLPF